MQRLIRRARTTGTSCRGQRSAAAVGLPNTHPSHPKRTCGRYRDPRTRPNHDLQPQARFRRPGRLDRQRGGPSNCLTARCISESAAESAGCRRDPSPVNLMIARKANNFAPTEDGDGLLTFSGSANAHDTIPPSCMVGSGVLKMPDFERTSYVETTPTMWLALKIANRFPSPG